jgi:hypothetical protein
MDASKVAASPASRMARRRAVRIGFMTISLRFAVF